MHLRKGTWQAAHLFWLTGHPTPWSHALHSIALGSPWEVGGDWPVTGLPGRDWPGLRKMGWFPTPTDWCGECEKKPSAQSCSIPQPYSCKTSTIISGTCWGEKSLLLKYYTQLFISLPVMLKLNTANTTRILHGKCKKSIHYSSYPLMDLTSQIKESQRKL